jgi:biotin carboxyl carrier protein
MRKTYRVHVESQDIDVTVEDVEGALLASLGGATQRVDVTDVGKERYSLVVDGRPHDVTVSSHNVLTVASPFALVIDGETYTVRVGGDSSSGRAGQGRQAPAAGEVRAPMPGLVVALQTAEGTVVAPGQPLIIMEAMKMQMEIRAPHAGTVGRLHVTAGQEVAGGQLLVTMR